MPKRNLELKSGSPDGEGTSRADHDNRLLQVLPQAEYDSLAAELEPVTLAAMQVLAEAGLPLDHVYFPRTTVISMVRRMGDGTMVEAGVVGREGMAGLAIAFGNTSSPEVVLASVPGLCHRLPARRFHELLPGLPVMRSLLDRYALVLIDQLSQTIACNSLHSIEQRCARWLLNAQDTAGYHDFHLTHEVLARMLGVRRAGVTVAALVLQREKLIDYSRGRVVILNRHGLEQAACECHALMRARIERFLGRDSPRV